MSVIVSGSGLMWRIVRWSRWYQHHHHQQQQQQEEEEEEEQ